jgi:2-oxoglutarate ferredoxin oxidoreductase subunit gamma
MRGGTANCNVIISDEEIASPYCSDLDILLTMNDVAIGKFEHRLRPGGLLLVNSCLSAEDRAFRDDVRLIRVPANAIAAELDNPRGVNVVMLGALACASPDFEEAYMREAVDNYFKKRGRVESKNRLCFDRGADSARAQTE